MVESFKKTDKKDQIVVVADTGLMSKQNIKEFIEKEYEFIVGARIKSETEALKRQILSLNLNDGQSAALQKQEGQKLIFCYSAQRAKKDEYNRKHRVKELEIR